MLKSTHKRSRLRSDDMESSPGNESKGSPNEEKNKQIYKNLLAQQCLGEDVFTLKPAFENMSMFTHGNSNTLENIPPQESSVYPELVSRHNYQSPGSVITQSKCNMLRFNTVTSCGFSIGEEEEYNPLKLRHSGFEDEMVTA